ncbi:MAG: PPOX class F420-dependent oxidoreductase [Sciscionella sp.]
MDISTAAAVLAEQHHAVLATMRGTGEPQLSPVVAAVDKQGRVLVSTRTHAYKVRNIRRDARVFLCVLPDSFFGNWIQVDGRAEIIDLPDAMAGLKDTYRSIAGEHEDWAEFEASMRAEERVLLRIDILKAGPNRSG